MLGCGVGRRKWGWNLGVAGSGLPTLLSGGDGGVVDAKVST